MKDGKINHYAEAHRKDGPQFHCYSKPVEPSKMGPEWTGDWESEVYRLKEQLAEAEARHEDLKTQLAEVAAQKERVVSIAVDMLVHGPTCADHCDRIRSQPFDEFRSELVALGCAYCNKEQLAERQLVCEQLQEGVQVLALQKAQVEAEREALTEGLSVERERRQWAEERVDELVKVCEEKQGRIERMEKTLQWYGNAENYRINISDLSKTGPAYYDAGKRAREALKEVPHE